MPTTLLDPSRSGLDPRFGNAFDRWPDDLRLLLGPDAAEMLAEFFVRLGGVVVAHRVKQVSHRPGRSTTVTYRADVHWASGRRSDETVIASTGEPAPTGATELSNGETSVAMWRWPHDPLLPGLASALDRTLVAKLFEDLGVGGGIRELRVRAYRPGRRAVVEATGDRGRVYLKVVRPHAVRRLHELHRSMAQHLPVPNSAGWSDDGILVMPAVPGATLREALKSPDGDVPAPAAIEQLLDAIPESVTAGKPRLHWLDHARHHARLIHETVPSAIRPSTSTNSSTIRPRPPRLNLRDAARPSPPTYAEFPSSTCSPPPTPVPSSRWNRGIGA